MGATIEQRRALATERMAARAAAEAIKAAKTAKAKELRSQGAFQVLLLEAGMPLVRTGGNGLRNLREDVFDAASNTNGRAGLYGISATYDTAMMGGEPFAVWN